MNPQEKRQLETELVRMGLAGLTESGEPSGELIDQIAALVSAWPGGTNKHGEWVDRHKYLRDLLAECDAADRQAMYDAIAPRLAFKAKPLHHYETMMAERIGNLVSKRAMRIEGEAPRPITVGDNRYAVVPQAVSDQAVATLTCHRCHAVEKFIADTPAGAMIAGRKAGWTREKGLNQETCPQCSAAVAETIVRLSHKETLAIYDRRSSKLTAKLDA